MDERQSSNFIRLLPTHKLSCNGMLEQNQMWRRRVGVEPTIRSAKGRISGFEGRDSHRTIFASS